mgnify:CR=1 FL=1
MLTGSGTSDDDASAPTSFDPLHLFESAKIVIDRIVRISVEVVIEVRDLSVWGVKPKQSGGNLRLHPLIHTTAPVNLAQSVVARCSGTKYG